MTTVENYLNDWLTLRSLTLKPRTIESYADLIRRYIVPAIGAADVDQLQPITVTRLLAGVVSAGHSRTAELIFVLLKAAFSDLEPSPMRRVSRPQHKQKSPEAWTNPQIRLYVDALSGHPHQLPLLLGIGLGLRRGEICGLRWTDIDFTNQQMHICNQRIRLDDGRIIDAPPKSFSSIRILPIPDPIFILLRKNRQLSGYICPLTPSGLDQAHRALTLRLDLPYIPLHGLRHSFATSCVRNGGEMASLQRVLGHASYTVTANRYTHPDQSMMKSAIVSAGDSWYTCS